MTSVPSFSPVVILTSMYDANLESTCVRVGPVRDDGGFFELTFGTNPQVAKSSQLILFREETLHFPFAREIPVPNSQPWLVHAPQPSHNVLPYPYAPGSSL